jgi:hypothetical protein
MTVQHSPSLRIDSIDVEAFRRHGVTAIRGLLSADWVDLLSELAADLSIGERNGMWRSCEPFARFLFGSPVGDVAARCMGSRTARLYEDLLLLRPAGGEGSTDWHRDSPHWPVVGSHLSSIWFTFVPIGGDTGAFQFVDGSHTDLNELIDTSHVMVGEAAVQGRTVLSFETDPGDVIVFHPRGLHMVQASTEDRSRYSFTLRFAGDDVRWRPRRSTYHPWMGNCGLERGDPLDHPWFPLVTDLRRQ